LKSMMMMPPKYSSRRVSLQAENVQNRAARRRAQAKWKQGPAARTLLQLAQDAESVFLVDRQGRSVEVALRDPEVYFYLVLPGIVEEAFLEPRIDEAFDTNTPIFLCFARREDAVKMQSMCCTLRLAVLPAAGRA
jgi:hypothetical protein